MKNYIVADRQVIMMIANEFEDICKGNSPAIIILSKGENSKISVPNSDEYKAMLEQARERVEYELTEGGRFGHN